eukprot:s6827_g1.t1
MSPNTAQTAVREEHGGDAGAMRRQHESLQVEASDGMRSHQEAVAVRAMAVAMTTAAGSPGREPALAMGPQGGLQFPEGAEQHALFHQGPDVEAHGMAASWGGGSPATGRVLPIWMQRLGAFFHEMRASQTTGAPPWMPSPFPSTPVSANGRRMLGSPNTDPGPAAMQPLFSREQRAQVRQMERRAPLLYGSGAGQGRGEASSGGSTAEAVQEEVRRQLRGVMDELAESKREASNLRVEVQRLRGQAEPMVMPQPEGLPRVFGVGLSTYSDVYARGVGLSTYINVYARGVGLSTYSDVYARGVGLSTYINVYARGVGLSTYINVYARGVGLSTYINVYAGGVGLSTYSSVYARGVGLSTYSSVYARGVGLSTYSNVYAKGAPRTSATHAASEGAGDTVTKLLQGLEAVLTKSQMKTQEEVTKSVVEAPKLAELSEASAIDFGDWIHCLENVMGDLSASSSEAVLEDAQTYYQKYVEGDQFARLALKPTLSAEAADSKWTRVDRRGAALILSAVPEDVKKELVASRSRTTLELLSKLMVMYRPGSTTEKSQLLKRVEAPEAANNVSEAVDHLRQWSRYFKRAKDLKLSTPDPSILLKALDGLARRPLQEHQDITFRMSLLRCHLKVDFAPTEDSIMAMQRAYLAEFEQMGYRKHKPGGGHQHQQPQPRIKAAELPPGTIPMPTPSPKAGSRPCKFFLSDDGCRRGKDCKYEHSMNSMSKAEKRERCYVCGAKGHMSSNCPTKTKDQKPVVAAVQGDSPQSSTGGTTNKKGQGGNRSEASTDAGSLTSSTSTPLAATTVPTQLSEVQGVPVEQLLEDAQKLMKAFMQQATPTAKAMRIRGAEWDELPALRELDADGGVISRKMGLLDSGATHAMQPRTPNDELRPTRTAEVTLAGDQKMEFPQTSSGVILAAPEAQPIVPLGSLIRALGYEFVWGRKGCVLRHPERPDVKVYDKSSCPEVRECDALRLIAELESAKVGEAMKSLEVLRAAIQVSKQRQPWDWWDAVKRYINEGTMDYGNQAVLAAPFMAEVPVELRTQVLEAIPGSGQEAWKALKHLPFNRAKRRALWKSDCWIIHMFAGEKFPGDPLQHGPGELLELDLRRGTNLMNPEVYGVLLWAAKHRKIKHIVGGPPSKTYSPLRGRDDLKALDVVRSEEELWGVGEGLQWEDRVMVSSENRMILKMVWLWIVAEAAMCNREQPVGEGLQWEDRVMVSSENRMILKMVWLWIVAEAAMCNREQPQYSKVGLCMEHPEDPRLYLPPGEIADRSVSMWRTTFIEGMVNAFGLEETAFDQGALGNPQRRPTRCLTNLELGLRGLRDSRASWPRPVRGEDPSVWPHGFREALCSAMKSWSRAMETDATTKAMSAKEKGEWKEHLINNHFPYRRDCSVCLQASGTGRPARKLEHRDAFVLSLDVAGPFATKGVDENRGSKHRFVLVGSYTFPKIKDIPAVGEGLQWEDRVMVSSENRMILKMVWLWIVAEAAMCNREQPQYSKVGLCMEHPEDPRLYLPPGEIADRSVSLWRTTFIEGMVNAFGLEETAFDQGALGNPQRRPTRCLTN